VSAALIHLTHMRRAGEMHLSRMHYCATIVEHSYVFIINETCFFFARK
jgi:hypothetical protein